MKGLFVRCALAPSLLSSLVVHVCLGIVLLGGFACTQNPKSNFKPGRSSQTVGKVQEGDLEAILSDEKNQSKIDQLLEGDMLYVLEQNLRLIKTRVGNDSVTYNGQDFFDLQVQLEESIEYLRDEGLGNSASLRDILEEEGISSEDFKKGRIDQELLDSTMNLAASYMTNGMSTFLDGTGSESSDVSFGLAGNCPDGSKGVPNRMRARSGNPTAPAYLCPATLPPVDCKAAGRAEKAGTIIGGTCGGAAVLCALGAIPTAGVACTGLAVCGAAAGAVAAGGAAAGAAGGC